MGKLYGIVVFLFFSLLYPHKSYSQYILNGSATQESCNCYQLTPAANTQAGSVWQSTKIDLTKSFDFSFNVYLGCLDQNGADGIVFMLQPNSTSIGSTGGGLGFEGIVPSIGISLDTYQNEENNDPPYDYISIQANGNIMNGNDLAGPVPASSTSNNIEDCNWHVFRIQWDAVNKTLNTYFDGAFRLTVQKDIVATIFNNSPLVYWGFSSATGGFYNSQKFCTALNPDFNSNLTNDAVCFGAPVTFTDHSVSFSTIQSYSWDFGDGTSSTDVIPPPHNYPRPGTYQVKHTITAADGCVSPPTIRTIMLGDEPSVAFNVYDTCRTISPRFENTTSVEVGSVAQWNWLLDGVHFSNIQQPDLSNVAAGNHNLELIATSSIGCVSTAVDKAFNIKNTPAIIISANSSCTGIPVRFTGSQTDNSTTISSWHWNFGDSQIAEGKDASHLFTAKNSYTIQLTAVANNGCLGVDTSNIIINEAHASAGNDTVVISNSSFQLHGSGGNTYSWSPARGLNNTSSADPVGKLSDDIKYLLTVKTIEGCTDTASVSVTVFKGSAIYVPTGFTPNGDGRNDILKPAYVGIKSLSYFTIYNRWGQKVFSTNDLSAGWNGTLKGQNLDTGSFVWILKATDFVGKIYTIKGSFVLLK